MAVKNCVRLCEEVCLSDARWSRGRWSVCLSVCLVLGGVVDVGVSVCLSRARWSRGRWCVCLSVSC